MKADIQTWALIDEKHHVGSLWPGKPIKEGDGWILGDQFINVPYEMVQGLAEKVLGRKMTEDDNPLDLTNFFNQLNKK